MPDKGNNTVKGETLGRNSAGIIKQTIRETMNIKLLHENVRTRNGTYAKPN
jgi:hypothetical protein